VKVTGTVPDVRPYLQYADAVVAPLRLARGVQNKVLEAMSMCKAVVSARGCAQVIGAPHGEAVFEAESADEYLAALELLLNDGGLARRVGAAARRYVLDHYSWDAHLSAIDGALRQAMGGAC
jgi:glycosyltransferase involved in cell wall biosynthesis